MKASQGFLSVIGIAAALAAVGAYAAYYSDRASAIPPPWVQAVERQQPPVVLGDRDAGLAAFRSNCVECHTQGRQSFNPESRGRLSLIQGRVREGPGAMHRFPPDRLSEADLSNILAYIATPAEPEPAPAPGPRGRGVNVELLDITNAQPGQSPSVLFRIKDDAGQVIPLEQMTAVSLALSGPTTQYNLVAIEEARRAEAAGDGAYRYSFQAKLPPDAAGTYAVSAQAALVQNLPGLDQPVRDVAFNPVRYAAVTDPQPVPRRTIVKTETCNKCHGQLALHGGSRLNTDYCVMCHTFNHTDEVKRKTANGPMPPEPVEFKRLIHRIHTGEDLWDRPWIIYGGSPANPGPLDMSKVHPFPKDRANCTVCHEPGTYRITSVVERSAAMTVTQDGVVVSQTPPITTACTACHSDPRAGAHAASMTSPQGRETCFICHGAGRPYSVDTVHRILGP